MISIHDLRARFESDPVPLQWGAIASDLARLSAIVQSGDIHSLFFQNVLNEAKLFTEWLAPEVDFEGQATILSLQRWLSKWPASGGSEESSRQVEKEAEEWSERILNLSGLLSQ